ncbi:hypothetical protein, partial [Glutamicibacter sp. NPDC087344]|uniref:hypothetical protein n=1 Tax=Glutamicibacter sp. NPDC087344 TaxID=3363994 RepID=UPI00381714D3
SLWGVVLVGVLVGPSFSCLTVFSLPDDGPARVVAASPLRGAYRLDFAGFGPIRSILDTGLRFRQNLAESSILVDY